MQNCKILKSTRWIHLTMIVKDDSSAFGFIDINI